MQDTDVAQALPKDSPIVQAFTAWMAQPSYGNARDWCIRSQDTVEGSLWRAFIEGYEAALKASLAAIQNEQRVAPGHKHIWRTAPNTNGLIDVCECGAERA